MAENAKPGHLWWVTTPQAAGDIEGYASQVSATAGETVTLFVSTRAASFHVEAYRMGYYGGIGGRLVWQSPEVVGVRQPPPTLTVFVNTIECQWAPSLNVAIDQGWPPGAYLLKLVGATGEQQFIPLCVRDDTSRAAFVIQQSVTTWQAYNRWGGYSLYYGNRDQALSFTHDPTGGNYADRARIVSFDRPYDHDWASGAADFIGNEFPVIYQAEQLGLDVTYWTDVDLHARPQLLDCHRALISLGHDEYWSAEMRDGAAQSLASGVNLAFLGANACYRQVRFEPSPLGPDRHQVCYKAADEDPMLSQDDALVTVNWPQAPVSRPEAELIGSTYQDIGAQADLVVADPTSWVLAGVALPADRRLPGAVQGEFDRYVPNAAGPENLDVIAHSIVPNRGNNFSGRHLVHRPRRGRGLRHRQRQLGQRDVQQHAGPAQCGPGGRGRRHRPAPADDGERLFGHRDRPGRRHPSLARDVGRRLLPRLPVRRRAQHGQRRLNPSAGPALGKRSYRSGNEWVRTQQPGTQGCVPGRRRWMSYPLPLVTNRRDGRANGRDPAPVTR